MKRFSSMLVAVLFVMSFMIVVLPGTADAATYKTVKFKLTSSSKVSWAKLYVNGVYKGHVRKSSYKRIRLRTGKTYRIVAKKTMGSRYFERKKSVYLSRSGSSAKLVFLHVSRKSGSSDDGDEPAVSSRYKTVKFKLTSSSKVSWAKLYVNGSYKGHVRKSSYTRVRLKTGKSYRIVAKKTMGRRYFERKKTLRVSSSSSSQTCFLHVSRKSGSSDSDDEPEVSSRKRIVKFKLTSTTKVAWAKLYVNGSYKGRVTRSSYKSLRLKSGKSYRIKVIRTYRGRRYYRIKTLRVGRGSSSQICFLHMSAR